MVCRATPAGTTPRVSALADTSVLNGSELWTLNVRHFPMFDGLSHLVSWLRLGVIGAVRLSFAVRLIASSAALM